MRTTLRVLPHEAGVRLDRWLSSKIPGLGRAGARAACAEGRVTVSGKRAKKSTVISAGDEIAIELELEGPPEPEPALPLAVRFESAALVVVSKPAGMPSAPLHATERGSLCAALLARYPEMAGVGHRPREPGLVHRLDTQTSGLVLAARSQAAFDVLWSALRAGEIEKRYLAIVEAAGMPDAGEIDRPLTFDERDPTRVRVIEDEDESRYVKAAHSAFRVLERRGRWALVELEVSRAFRHQIRAHLAAIGHPIAGDRIYGGPAVEALGERHALHASYMAWAGDGTLPGFATDDPLPDELRALLAG